MIGRTTHLEGSRELNHARAPNDNDATELRIANDRCNRSTITTKTATNAAVALFLLEQFGESQTGNINRTLPTIAKK